ncbi:MAG: SUF system NifU family Fe-S cluster assembly protein [Bacteroidetes bacterium]|nr:SUF system NifU family Fe-S cluster assembly protein [Bacteroidota bacterium]
MNELNKLYPPTIREHNTSPFHFEQRKDRAVTVRAYNPICGDRFDLFIEADTGATNTIYFHGFGCAISKASASVMAKSLSGKARAEALRLCNNFLDSLDSDSDEALALPEEWKAFRAVREYPERRDCAALAWAEMKKYLESNPS